MITISREELEAMKNKLCDKQLHDFRCAALNALSDRDNISCDELAIEAEKLAQAMLKIARGDKS